MKVIVFTNANGGVSVMTPVLATNAINDEGVWLPLRTGQTPPEGYRYPTVEEVAAKDCVIKIYKKDENGQFVLDENGLRVVERIEPVPYIIIDDSELPDRNKREAWVIVGGVVGIDESRITKPPLSERLAEKFRGLLTQYGSQVSKQTRKEIMELEARGNRYLQFGLADDWQQDIADYTPADPADQALVAQLKQVILEEF